MRKTLAIIALVALLASCSKTTENTNNLAGRWTIYKLTRQNIEQTSPVTDTTLNYSITFTTDGKFLEKNAYTPLLTDTFYNLVAWTFLKDFSQLQLTDTAKGNKARVYTIFNLTENHVELTRNSETRYMRKDQ